MTTMVVSVSTQWYTKRSIAMRISPAKRAPWHNSQALQSHPLKRILSIDKFRFGSIPFDIPFGEYVTKVSRV